MLLAICQLFFGKLQEAKHVEEGRKEPEMALTELEDKVETVKALPKPGRFSSWRAGRLSSLAGQVLTSD